MKPSQVILIGPVCVGKSTLAPLVAQRLGLEAVDLDRLLTGYSEEVGVGIHEFNERIARDGYLVAYRWWERGHPHAVRRVLEEHPAAVVSLGAGHTHFHNPKYFAEMQRTLADHFTVLILPTLDLDRTVDVLRARSVATRKVDWRFDGYDFIEHWVKDPDNDELAQLTIYTENRSPTECAEEIATRARLGWENPVHPS